MNQIQAITSITDYQQVVDTSEVSVILSKDQWLGECLDDYLFKLCGTDQVVWIPKKYIYQSQQLNHAFEALLPLHETYCCAKLMISNSIRMCLIDQHQVTGVKLLPYMYESIE